MLLVPFPCGLIPSAPELCFSQLLRALFFSTPAFTRPRPYSASAYWFQRRIAFADSGQPFIAHLVKQIYEIQEALSSVIAAKVSTSYQQCFPTLLIRTPLPLAPSPQGEGEKGVGGLRG